LSFFREEGEFATCVFRNHGRTSLAMVWLAAGLDSGKRSSKQQGWLRRHTLDLVLTGQICESREQQCMEAVDED